MDSSGRRTVLIFKHRCHLQETITLLVEATTVWSLFFIVHFSERCSQILDPGPCRDYVVKWYYDATANACAQFWYGGCLGNGNQFETEKSCVETCVKV
uniref:BPTI/Kunitz inhibitor domain-containing protein n=1 Tax=Acanthochromis polyacanthus TaxID=80966 RepID=A0A3Q1FHN2_9TELE